jgi:uncharacterized SAM-binding protein YcdF (DUF218 family)
MMMGGVTIRNMQSSLQKYEYNKLYIVASSWTITDMKMFLKEAGVKIWIGYSSFMTTSSDEIL